MRDLALVTRDRYYFYEKNTGASRFQVEATPDGRFPVDQAAGLLATYCILLGQSPSDYVVMVSADIDTLKGLTEKAEELLQAQAGHSVSRHIKVTRREEEVLSGIIRSFANKEIAASLNLSERTVKFHVSSLLAKFRVRGRMELVREATRHIAGSVSTPLTVATRETRSYAPVHQSYSNRARSADVVSLAKRQMMA
jgi:DNA-binding CsgD family transcriptional regulator